MAGGGSRAALRAVFNKQMDSEINCVENKSQTEKWFEQEVSSPPLQAG